MRCWKGETMADKGIYALLAEAQGEMKPPKKDKTGQVGPRKYEYASLDAVLASIKPPLNAKGLFLTQKTATREAWLAIQTIVVADEVPLVLDEQPYEYDPKPQELGERETYAKRYSLCKAFAIVGEEDTDGDVERKASKAGRPVRRPEPDADIEEVKALKAEAVKAGIKEEGVNAWYAAKFGKAPMNKLTHQQLNELKDYLRTVTEDARSLKEGEGDEHQ